MERTELLSQVQTLREDGKSIRAIAAELDVHRSTVERTLKALARAPGVSVSNAVFVGRQSELAELQETFQRALSGQGGIVMLAGEPGIGKTRMAQELASVAETRGAQVFWGWQGGSFPCRHRIFFSISAGRWPLPRHRQPLSRAEKNRR